MAPPARKKAALPARRLTVTIGEIGARGDGVAYVDGAPVFVPLTAPGDRALIEARGDQGRVVELFEESPHRANPPCPHYGACGGCALQHVTADYYRGWKRRRIVEALARAGLGDAPVSDLVATPAASRRRASFAVGQARPPSPKFPAKAGFQNGVCAGSPPSRGRTGEGGASLDAKRAHKVLGFNARRSSDIVPVETCLVLHPDLLAALPKLRFLAGAISTQKFDLAVTLCNNGLDINMVGAIEELRGMALQDIAEALAAARGLRLALDGEALITNAPPLVDFDGIVVTPPPGGFLQASREGEAALLALVKGAAAGARKIADLFAGSGAFALPLARAASVCAADSDAAAIAALMAAAANAQRMGAGVNPVRAETRNLFERPLSAGELNTFDAVIFDPPRAGAREQAEALAKSAVPLVVGVSCNPASFARDAAILSRGGFILESVTPVDQFVYSPHVELVGVFRRS